MSEPKELGQLFRSAFEDFQPAPAAGGFEAVQSKLRKSRNLRVAKLVAASVVLGVTAFFIIKAVSPENRPLSDLSPETGQIESSIPVASDASVPALPAETSLNEPAASASNTPELISQSNTINPAAVSSQSGIEPAVIQQAQGQNVFANASSGNAVQPPASSNRVNANNEGSRTIISCSNDTAICLGDQAILKIIGGQSWSWANGETDQSINVTPTATTYYSVTVLDEQGASHSYRIKVEVRDCAQLIVPSGFTPNNDGLNDVFMPGGRPVDDYSMRVYARNGSLIFQSFDFFEGWNGEIDGMPAQEGVYVYVITYVNRLGQPIQKRGSVTLLK